MAVYRDENEAREKLKTSKSGKLFRVKFRAKPYLWVITANPTIAIGQAAMFLGIVTVDAGKQPGLAEQLQEVLKQYEGQEPDGRTVIQAMQEVLKSRQKSKKKKTAETPPPPPPNPSSS